MWEIILGIALLVLVVIWWIPPIRSNEPPIVFFDGVCNLCNNFINFLITIDHKQILRIAPIQGTTAKIKIQDPQLREKMGSIIFWVDGKTYLKSSAFLKIMRSVGGLWSLFIIFWIVPRFIRDAIYDWTAKNRYKWFGKRETCRLPTDKEKKVFLD